ncbi:acyltransferase family protein [Mammaliicoccus lentus]|uniref:acyltransferase family protein n=1 Tax=Mammaliicoccus lentus TaxID=42858 RepID=UPI0015F57567|nr:acyltransferase family protein [Mammaliicoccus lentus]QMU10157.1 acyltransferase family protein [Mammaliicoccus lentus]WGZ42827.1 acyltransferase family protein [Mammaliicoccus lentus]
MQKKLELTYARAIFCLTIVLLHSMTGFLNDSNITYNQKMTYSFVQVVLLFATPCFIILSETLLGMRYSNYIPKNFLRKRVKYILIPYLFFALFVSFNLYFDGSSDKSLWEIILGIVIQGQFFGWFILVIFQFYILHALFYKILSKIKPIYPLVFSFIISFIHSYLMYNNLTYFQWWDSTYPFFTRTIIFYWLFYFIVGFYIGKYYEEIMEFLKGKLKYFIIIWLLAILYMAFNFFHLEIYLNESNRYDLLLFSSLSFLLVIYILKNFGNKEIPFMMMISEISFFIYLSHQIIVDYVSKSLAAFVSYPILFFVLTTSFTLAFSIGLAIVFSFIPYFRLVTSRNSLHDMTKNNYLTNNN